MTTPVLTLDEAKEILTALVSERGRDYVNPKFDVGDVVDSCVYFLPDGCPSCGVGGVIAAKGVTMLNLQEGDNTLTSSNLLDTLSYRGILETDYKTRQFLRDFQSIQDGSSNNTWGEALDFALEELENHDSE